MLRKVVEKCEPASRVETARMFPARRARRWRRNAASGRWPPPGRRRAHAKLRRRLNLAGNTPPGGGITPGSGTTPGGGGITPGGGGGLTPGGGGSFPGGFGGGLTPGGKGFGSGSIGPDRAGAGAGSGANQFGAGGRGVLGDRAGQAETPPGAALGEEAATSRLGTAASGRNAGMGMGMPMGMGTGHGQDGRERERTTCLSEDEDMWRAGDDASPPVLG
jgi:hypothetical protein